MEKLKLYSLATPNGQKASVMLEETGIPYDAHLIDITKGDQFADWFVALNPNSKIPTLVDPNPTDGPMAIMESGAILLYLAEKSGRFLPTEPRSRNIVMQWLFFQVGHVGPMFGQFGHFFRYAKEKCDHPYPLERYTNEAKRLLAVLEKQLAQSQFIAANDYTIADIAIFPWVLCLEKFYQASEPLELASFTKVQTWLKTCLDRPAVEKGLKVCSLDNP